ncbi:endonuclease/exonuclease/phosphatase family protein [Pyxidicoccus caerfyrddinensis]|uniref:endonuclease/exonuclease/phosphatase family protein n=1 Tax=Pyxidicoccus caerfyrddinensis TaxID=2709663 RepID=UPI0019671DD4|nr:endonuclease/exonuclease/phosphatase family protein [Pyxidicoccus caerfyrddinensis]
MRIPRLAALLLFVACGSGPASTPPPFKAMTHNVLSTSSFEGVEKSVDVIEAAKPDILCLQELTPRFAWAFERRLGKEYSQRRFVPQRDTWGVGIATRHRLLRTAVFPQRPHRMPAMEADVLVNGRRLKVVCVHLRERDARHAKDDDLLESLPENADLGDRQSKALVDRYAKEKTPLLLLGDMNEGRGGPAMKAFASAGFTHACDGPDASCGATWPATDTMFFGDPEIDHILGRGLALSGSRVLDPGGSDHFALGALFDFAP